MSTKPLPKVKEAFSEVLLEESRKKVTMASPTLSSDHESYALAVQGQSHGANLDNRRNKRRPWCDRCRKPEHYKETCSKIHGKPTNWKPKSWGNRESQGNIAATASSTTEGKMM